MTIEEIKNKILCGDVLSKLKEIPDECIDLMLTDPPYNAKNIGPQQKVYSLGQMQILDEEYRMWCKQWFQEARRVSKRLVFTPGISNITYYPQPYWVLCWHKPAAVSFNRLGGFNAWEPIFIYDKPVKGQRLGQDYILCNTLNFTKGPEREHPCPKPPELWAKLINAFSEEGELVGDCFMGSGTTAYVARKLKRNFVGIELNPEYIKLAEKRLAQQILI